MTIPYERTRALVLTKELLAELADPEQSPCVPAVIRRRALHLLEHFPTLMHIERTHKELPDIYGPVPPFQRLPENQEILNIVDAISQATLLPDRGDS